MPSSLMVPVGLSGTKFLVRKSSGGVVLWNIHGDPAQTPLLPAGTPKGCQALARALVELGNAMEEQGSKGKTR